MTNITTLEKNKCNGCSACCNVCPSNAITMQKNNEGFLYPQIDNDKCTNCGLCIKSCSAVNSLHDNYKSPECYVVHSDDQNRENYIFKNKEKNSNNYLIYGDFNHTTGSFIYSNNTFFPLKEIEFEETKFNCPNKCLEIMSDIYGNYNKYPQRITMGHSMSIDLTEEDKQIIADLKKKVISE